MTEAGASIVVSEMNYPSVFDAFVGIECDSGAHLIGTVYPGKKVDLTAFEVPGAFTHLLVAADRGLARLSADDFETFTIGDQDTMNEIRDRDPDLGAANQLLEAFYYDWDKDEDYEPEPDPVEHLSFFDTAVVIVSCTMLTLCMLGALYLVFTGAGK